LSCAIALLATNAIAAVTPIARDNMFNLLPRQAAHPASIVCRSTARANVPDRSCSHERFENQALTGLSRGHLPVPHHSGVYDSGKCIACDMLEAFRPYRFHD
jgi:hypothetical protein